MNQNQTLHPASPQALKVLLLMCAGALLAIVLLLSGVVRDTQSAAVMHAATQTANAQSIVPRGPAADPYLRHVPGGYDYELEAPPEELR